MDDVILAHKRKQLNVAAQLMEAQPTAALSLAINGAYEYPLPSSGLTGRPTFRVQQSAP